MSKKAVHFFYDVVSPYSYFGFEILCRYKSRWNLDLKLRPFFLGGVMKGSGNKPPAMHAPDKGKYLSVDVERCSKYYDLPTKFPHNPQELMFANGTITAQRFLTVLDMERPELVEKVSRELWLRAWVRDEDIIKPDGIAAAAKAAGMELKDIESMLSKVKNDDVKKRLMQTTQEALDLGGFGSPMIVFDANNEKQMIFGSDRFPVMAHMLGLKWEGPNPGVSSRL